MNLSPIQRPYPQGPQAAAAFAPASCGLTVDAILDGLPIPVCAFIDIGYERFRTLYVNRGAQVLLQSSKLFSTETGGGGGPCLDHAPDFGQALALCAETGSQCAFSWQVDVGGVMTELSCGLRPIGGEGSGYLLLLKDRQAGDGDAPTLPAEVLRDGLTRLPNQIAFTLRLNERLEARRPGCAVIIMMINLNRFQVINESLGHGVGDKLLADVAARLTGVLPPDALLARFGRDEFAVLLPESSEPNEAVQRAAVIHNSLNTPFLTADHDILVSASIGIAMTSPRVSHAEDLLRNASNAMHRAKREAMVKTVVFHDELQARARSQFKFETDLRRALDQGELMLHYQPIVALSTGQLVGLEALSRWNHPERGPVSPAEFIPVAEASGLILRLGDWAIDSACHQLARWQQIYPAAAALSVNVNVSGLQISCGELVSVVRRALMTSGLSGQALELEITESALMSNAELAVDLMLDLKSCGVGLAIDDFGTGYSSLSYLNRFPVDTLKIDRSFVRELGTSAEDLKIVHIITMLAGTLGLTVVAEGIEKNEQLQHLVALGCHYGQGFLFAKPMTTRDIEDRFLNAAHASIDSRRA